jgi:hypothetical protein
MRGEAKFSVEDAKRYGIIQLIINGRMTNGQSALAVRKSVRQVQRMRRKVERYGDEGVCHGNRGRRPLHTFPAVFRDRVIALAQEKYYDFNFSHLSDTLAEAEGMRVNRETLRQWLRPLRCGGKVRRLAYHRRRRTRSAQEGHMLFLDGSPHPWFAGVSSTLILCMDDASGRPLGGIFQPEEDLDGCFEVCLSVFKKPGLPASFYLDRASQFTTTRHGGIHSPQSAETQTHFERAMRELGSLPTPPRHEDERIVPGASRVKGIVTAHEATRYLTMSFIPRYARRFSVTPQDPIPAWRPLPAGVDIRNILCKRFIRTVTNDNTVSVNRHSIQLLPTRRRSHVVHAKVAVNLWTDGSWHVLHPTEGDVPCVQLDAKSARPAGAPGELKAGARSASAPHLPRHTAYGL